MPDYLNGRVHKYSPDGTFLGLFFDPPSRPELAFVGTPNATFDREFDLWVSEKNLGKKHFDHLVSYYISFYNEFRPHQGLENRPLTGKWPDDNQPFAEGEEIVCHESLGGILRHYERVAA